MIRQILQFIIIPICLLYLPYSFAEESNVLNFEKEFTVFKPTFGSVRETAVGRTENRIIMTRKFQDEVLKHHEVPNNRLYVVCDQKDRVKISIDIKNVPLEYKDKIQYVLYSKEFNVLKSGRLNEMMPMNVILKYTVHESDYKRKYWKVLPFKKYETAVLYIGYAVDFDNNNELASNEIFEFQEKPEIHVISRHQYKEAFSFLRLLNTSGKFYLLPITNKLLNIFLSGKGAFYKSGIQYKSEKEEKFNCYTDTFSEWLTHNAGFDYIVDSSGATEIDHYTWEKNHTFSKKIAESMHVRRQIATIIRNKRDNEMYNKMKELSVGDTHTFNHWQFNGPWHNNNNNLRAIKFGSRDFDLSKAIGRSSLDYHEILVTVVKLSPTFWKYINIKSKGSITDLYDFNITYDTGDIPTFCAAVLQLGYENNRTSGEIFKTTFEWNYEWSNPDVLKKIIRLDPITNKKN